MANVDNQQVDESGQATNALKQEQALLHLASGSLRMRYQQANQDFLYLRELMRFHLPDEYSQHFEFIEQGIKDSSAEVARIDGHLGHTFASFIGHYDTLSKQLGEEKDFQKMWHGFRTAIEQRMVLRYRHFLRTVDIIIRDCFYALSPVNELAGSSTPLLQKQLPIAILRIGKVYQIITTRETLLPLIEIPIDRMDAPWNLCAIHHEVAHELFHRLTSAASPNADPEADPAEYFKRNIQARMEAAKNKAGTAVVFKVIDSVVKFGKEDEDRYLMWVEEVFADMVGIMLGGSGYINSLQEILLKTEIFTGFSSEYPSPYFRVKLNVIFAEKLGLRAEAKSLWARWQAIFSEQEHLCAVKTCVKNDLSDLEELSSDGIEEWLTQLVEAFWEAGISPGCSSEAGGVKGDINLRRLYERMKLLEYNDLFKRGQKKLKIDRFYCTQEDKLRAYWEDVIAEAKTALVKLERTDCIPRYLVPALRLAYESTIVDGEFSEEWATAVSRHFLASVHERAAVANAFAAR